MRARPSPARDRQTTNDPPLAVQCKNLTRTFGAVRALDDVTFDIAVGELFGLIGPNGAGKTTTMRVLTGLIPATSGHAMLFGHDLRRQTTGARRLFGYVPQLLSADGSLTGYENVWLYARLYDVPRRERPSRIRESLHLMGLDDAAERRAATYSGGMLRRLELAQSLVSRPRLLFLDEPTVGLDPVGRGQVWDRLRTLRDDTGLTILLTTHYMDEADQLCDRIAMLDSGKLCTIGTPTELKAAVGPDATLEDVFRRYAGSAFEGGGSFQDVRRGRRNARRLG